jgi:VWFA-related protein
LSLIHSWPPPRGILPQIVVRAFLSIACGNLLIASSVNTGCQRRDSGEPMFSRASLAVLILIPLFPTPRLTAQTQAQSQNQPSNQPYTIQANSRVVLTDVTVTDRNGNPVHGLPQSAFQIFDNGKPQTISSFEEHTGVPAVAIETAEASKGVYSNDYLLHLPPALNIVLIDIANLEIPDQMYLNYELTKFFKEQPLGQPLAIFLRAGNGCFLVQNFTSDRDLLLAALRKAIPRIPPTGREYLSDLETMYQIAGQLSQLPGRKNVLWFSGGSTLYLREDAEIFDDPAAWRSLYDELEQERIAVYPIDARGLINPPPRQLPLLWSQHAQMNETALATGGQAFHDNNGLLEITSHILSSDSSFYTLTYAPHDFHFDNKWHKVRVALNVEGYELSYRRGYFADGSPGGAEQPQKTRARTRLLPDGESVQVPAMRSVPIIFQARVLPASDPAVISVTKVAGTIQAPPAKKGSVPYSVRYSLPLDALTQQVIDGKSMVTFGIAAVALNRDGRPVDGHANQVTMTLNSDVIRLHPELPLVVDQILNLKKDDEYLYLAVWDMSTGRLGTLQVPVQVPKPGKPVRAN